MLLKHKEARQRKANYGKGKENGTGNLQLHVFKAFGKQIRVCQAKTQAYKKPGPPFCGVAFVKRRKVEADIGKNVEYNRGVKQGVFHVVSFVIIISGVILSDSEESCIWHQVQNTRC